MLQWKFRLLVLVVVLDVIAAVAGVGHGGGPGRLEWLSYGW